MNAGSSFTRLALARLGVRRREDLDRLGDAERRELALAAEADRAYGCWLDHRGSCPACRPGRPCGVGVELAERYRRAWVALHPPTPRRAWGRCTTCGERTPLVLRGAWCCPAHGGRPVPAAGGGEGP
jgi:hypothetical protein